MGIPSDSSIKPVSVWEVTFVTLLGYSLLGYFLLWLFGATLPGQWELVQILSRITAFILILPQASHSISRLRRLPSQGTPTS